MNLRQAYDGWSQQSQNKQLYVKTRDAFRRAWFTLPTNKPCSWYTKDILALALAETRVVESDKVKSASVMVHVLTWANFAEPKWNPKPNFKTEDVTRLLHLPADELEKERQRITAAMQTMTEPEQPKSDEGNNSDDDADPLAGIDFDDKKQVADALMEQSARIMNDKQINETSMEQEKKPRGKAPKPVAQIHPDTFEVVKVWPSRGAAENELGACNLDRCIAKLRKSAGFYWSDPQDAETFKLRLMAKQAETPSAPYNMEEQRHPNPKPKKEEPAPDEVPASVAASAPTPKFKAGDHVWAKQPKALAGRTGIVKFIDTYRMEYSVLFDVDLWLLPEANLELVNEPVSSGYLTKRITEGLADYTDDELLEELDRRGWEGELSRRQVVTIGSKD